MITSDGTRLHVTTYGPADAPLTVLLSHCWTADSEDWHYQVRDLLARYGHGIRIVTWDHRGHGRSAWAAEDCCTIEQLGQDLGEVADEYAGPGPLVLAGHSIGGMTIMALPKVRPDLVERVSGLVFVATSGGGLSTVTLGLRQLGPRVRRAIPRILATRARVLSKRERRRSPSIERQVVNRFLFGRPMRLRDAGLVVDQIVACSPETMAGFFRDCMLHERLDLLSAYDGVPTRVLVGTADLLTPLRHARELANAIQGARLVVAPGAGHMLTLERDRLVSDELIEVIDAAL